MAVISKFYLHDATSPNTGTMPSASPATNNTLSVAVTGEATGSTTARDATDTIGAANPDTESSITSLANTNGQAWGHRKFVSRPLAAVTLPAGTWTFSYARTESNLNHNQKIACSVNAWRPSTGALVGGAIIATGISPSVAAAEQAESRSFVGSLTTTILDGDILVFDVWTEFGQAMATAYTDSFAYDGTTEASTTTCASFVSPPSALTLFGGAAPDVLPDVTTARARF